MAKRQRRSPEESAGASLPVKVPDLHLVSNGYTGSADVI
jgi:hypothetical protein